MPPHSLPFPSIYSVKTILKFDIIQHIKCWAKRTDILKPLLEEARVAFRSAQVWIFFKPHFQYHRSGVHNCEDRFHIHTDSYNGHCETILKFECCVMLQEPAKWANRIDSTIYRSTAVNTLFFSINTCHLGKVVIFLLNTSAKILESRILLAADSSSAHHSK